MSMSWIVWYGVITASGAAHCEAAKSTKLLVMLSGVAQATTPPTKKSMRLRRANHGLQDRRRTWRAEFGRDQCTMLLLTAVVRRASKVW